MTLTILQMWSGKDWTPLADLLRPNLAEYCERHGYHIFERQVLHDLEIHTCWRRIEWVRDCVAGPSDYFWILDLDIAITNMTIPALKFTDKEHDVFMCGDVNGFNAGSFIVRNNERVVLWLKQVMALRGYATGDQHAMEILSRTQPNLVKMKMVAHPAFNSIAYEHYPEFAGKVTEAQGDWRPGHLLVHLPGKNNQDRERLLRGYQERVAR